MTVLVAGASVQSRARRPMPDEWKGKAIVISRSAKGERWHIKGVGEHIIDLTWTQDQGGPVLGYTSPKNPHTQSLIRTVRSAERKGLHGPGSIVSRLEEEAAELLVDTVGEYINSDSLLVRFLANGSDATDCAVRLARAVTGRTNFVSVGYHGSGTIFAHRPQNHGIPLGAILGRHDVEFGDMQKLDHLGTKDKLACIIVEVPAVGDREAKEFLQACVDVCQKQKALLIFDELVTGFRLALGGAAEFYGIKPDIACYGKALSNGRGISAVVGPADVMNWLESQVFYSNTFNGDPLNCAHIIGTLRTLRRLDDQLYGHIWYIGKLLKDGFNSMGLRCIGQPVRSVVIDERWSEICKQLPPHGLVMDRPNYSCFAHIELDVRQTLEIVGDCAAYSA